MVESDNKSNDGDRNDNEEKESWKGNKNDERECECLWRLRRMVKGVNESGSCKCEGGYKIKEWWKFVCFDDSRHVVCWLKGKKRWWCNDDNENNGNVHVGDSVIILKEWRSEW